MLHTTKRTTSPAVRFSYGSHTLYGLYNTISFSHCAVRFLSAPFLTEQGTVFQTIKYASCTIRCVSCLIKHALIFCGQINLSFLKFHQSNCRNKIIRPFRPSSEQFLFVTYQEVKFFMNDRVRFSYDTFFERQDTILIRYESCTLIIRFVGVAVRSRVCKYTLN